MSRNRNLGRPSATALAVLMAVLALPSSSWAQSKYKTLYKFTGGNDGAAPQASLIFDSAGNLYGTTTSGGNCNGCGVVFKLTRNSEGGGWTENVLHSFTGGADGGSPSAGLIFDMAGNLYGTTSVGGADGLGIVFELTLNANGSWTESVLHSFTGGEDGALPDAGLIFDHAGNLYGTATAGGTHAVGVVFRLSQNTDKTWTESVLHSFCSLTNCSDGLHPEANLIFDASGSLYGTTINGGSCDPCGVVFKLTPESDGSWSENVLHSFCSFDLKCDDGTIPFAGLIFDAVGNLYGATMGGGAHRDGVVFKLSPNSDGTWTEKVLHAFAGTDGISPASNLVFDRVGNLYSTTLYGGDRTLCAGLGCGTVIKLTSNSKNGWNGTLLHTFVDHPGAHPSAGVIFDAAGNLYGTTQGDLTGTFGSVFKIMP